MFRIDEISRRPLTATACAHLIFDSNLADALPRPIYFRIKNNAITVSRSTDRPIIVSTTLVFFGVYRAARTGFRSSRAGHLKGRPAGAVSSRAHRSERNIADVLPVIQSSTTSPVCAGVLKLAAHRRLTIRWSERDNRNIT